MKNLKPCLRLTGMIFLLTVIYMNLFGQSKPLRVGVDGLSHDHVHGLLQQFKKGEVDIVGIAEQNAALVKRLSDQYKLTPGLFYKSLSELLKAVKPEVVLAYNPISEHINTVEACAPLGISVMVEKPLAFEIKDAERIALLARQYKVHVLTNYETTWYPSNQQMKTMVSADALGAVRKMVVHDGHQGPKEIGCSADFLSWLTDPVRNGGGAIIDFGCYGANLMTWMMDGKQPVAVTAITRQIKPTIYPAVDDEATILVEYAEATGIIEASWNWPFSIKDFEVYGTTGYLHAMNKSTLRQRKKETYEPVEVRPLLYADNLTYLADVMRGKIKPEKDLSSLENNMVVVKILDAARRSAREGRRIIL